MSTALFLPTRKGSQRVPNKNTRKFAEFEGGLLELKLKQLSKVGVEEVILSTNDEASIEIAKSLKSSFSNLIIDKRPDHLASSATSLSDLIKYVPSITQCEHILWTHVTSPFINSNMYDKCVNIYQQMMKKGYDSLMTVNSFKNFLWDKDKNDLINRVGDRRWPQTQDLRDLFEINSAVFIAPRKVYEEESDRVGKKPFLMEISKIEALDIDWEDDFKIAEAVYDQVYK